MKILILNAGSSSLKYKLFANNQEIAGGIVEAIGESGACANHEQALIQACQNIDVNGIEVVGHRVVHGGTLFYLPTEINDTNFVALKEISHLAPLHNPVNILGIETARKLLPNAKHFAVFDTAFHHTLPEAAYTYALNQGIAQELQIRRYGFHGISHEYVSRQACKILASVIDKTELITLHLGNGASITAIQNGHSIETSMGMTPLEGLVMGTRSGDVDPAVVLILAKYLGSNKAADDFLNKNSGLKGICGDNDLRIIEKRAQQGDVLAKLALEIMVHRLVKYIGAYVALLPNLKALVFTGGVGENSQWVRQMILTRLKHFGIDFDSMRNKQNYQQHLLLTQPRSKIHALAIRTNEELAMAQQIIEFIL